MIPPFRVVPATAAQREADVAAPLTAFFTCDLPALTLATAALGLGMEHEGDVARVVVTPDNLERLGNELADRGAGSAADYIRGYLSPVREWRLRTRALPLDRPHIMGILNLTDDSFSGDGVGASLGRALRRADELRAAGAAIIDVGAESARADRPVRDTDEEAQLVGESILALVGEGHAVSADTYKPAVATAALAAGAEAVNDISGLTGGAGAAEGAAAAGAGYVLNYSFSVPKRRPDKPPRYRDVVAETLAWMFERVERLRAIGLSGGQIALDPGIAFGKSHDQDLQVVRRLGEFTSPGLPLLLAHSRKNFIGSVTGRPPADRDLETNVITAQAYMAGVRVFRVHDVAGTARALEIAQALVADAGDFAPDADSWPWRAGASAAHTTTAPPGESAPPGQRW